MMWLKKLFKKKKSLRDKLVEIYGEEAGEAYDKINEGVPMGGFLETIIFLQMVKDTEKLLKEEQIC